MAEPCPRPWGPNGWERKLDKGVNGLELELGPEINVVGITDLLEKLAAVTARGGGDSEIVEVGLVIEGEIGEEKLLSVD